MARIQRIDRCRPAVGCLLALVLCSAAGAGPLAGAGGQALTPPVAKSGWLVPAEGRRAAPVWGIQGGMAVGLWPMSGPRGLIRIYTPYLGQPRGRMINYVAVEPVVRGRRGLSELERSAADGVRGKAMWTEEVAPGGLMGTATETTQNGKPGAEAPGGTMQNDKPGAEAPGAGGVADAPGADGIAEVPGAGGVAEVPGAGGIGKAKGGGVPKVADRRPARARFFRIGEAEAMTFLVRVERFGHGAEVAVQVVLRKDRPHEVAFRVYSRPGGAKLDACVLTATMGNYARLRRLHLKGKAVLAGELWPGFARRHATLGGFAPPRRWPADELTRVGPWVVVAATPSEARPAGAVYDRRVPPWWRYQGRWATQYWYARAEKKLRAAVNGRSRYWGSGAPIPGGVALENFELVAAFRSGQEFVFGVSPNTPETVLEDLRKHLGRAATR